MSSTEKYIGSMASVVILSIILIILREKQIISFKTLRRSLVTAIALTTIPGTSWLPWPFAIGLTLAGCAWFYWITWAYEKTYKTGKKL